MPLAMIAGAAPSVATAASLPAADVVLLGVRDLFDVEAVDGGQRVVNTGIRVRDLAEIRRAGPSAVARSALSDLSSVDALWVHLDVDVLTPEIMPAVDSPDPGGLAECELVELLRALLASSLVVGMHVSIYDPERDPQGSAGRLLVRALKAALTGSTWMT
jgi:arginase